MYENRIEKIWSTTLLILLLGLIVFPQQVDGAEFLPHGTAHPVEIGAGDFTTFLPLVSKNYPPPSPIFGVESNRVYDYLEEHNDASVTWVRRHVFSWKTIEPVRKDPPEYLWNSVDEEFLVKAAANQQTIVAVTRYAPDWATKYPGVYCGPFAQDSFDEFAQFMQALVDRYSGPPYNIKYWELGNEVDVEVQPAEWSMGILGCWGEVDDPYDGGGYYADMLKQAYPAIKAADPSAHVLVGGLLMGCDPDNPPPNMNCKSSRFLEGILKNSGGPYFDIISFHSYAFYWNNAIHDTDMAHWLSRGGQIMGKINFLHQVLQAYNTSKPLMLTEISLLCVPEWTSECDPAGDPYFQAQADFVVTSYIRTWAAGIKSTIWYPLENNGWRYAGLLESYQEARPAYFSFAFLTNELGQAEYVNQINQFSNVTGYKFHDAQKQIWVLWSSDNVEHAIVLPINVIQVLDKYGDPIIPNNGEVTVKSPLYIELTK